MHTTDLVQTRSTRLRVIVALDFTDADGTAFDRGAHIVRRLPGAELHLVHVFPHEQSPESVRDLLGHLRLYVEEKAAVRGGLGGVNVGIHLRSGKAVREIARLANELDATVIVLGSHPGVHLRRWLTGSLAEKLIQAAHCPVMTTAPQARAALHEPTIEPPCPLCVQARQASHGAQWWCAHHAHETNGAHGFSYERELPMGSHDSEVTPIGVDF